jgi:hypothetical protein
MDWDDLGLSCLEKKSKMPKKLPWLATNNKLIWHYNHNGTYIITSGY